MKPSGIGHPISRACCGGSNATGSTVQDSAAVMNARMVEEMCGVLCLPRAVAAPLRGVTAAVAVALGGNLLLVATAGAARVRGLSSPGVAPWAVAVARRPSLALLAAMGGLGHGAMPDPAWLQRGERTPGPAWDCASPRRVASEAVVHSFGRGWELPAAGPSLAVLAACGLGRGGLPDPALAQRGEGLPVCGVLALRRNARGCV